MLNTFKMLASVLVIALLFGGCAKDKLILNSYSPPKKQAQVKKMLENSESSTGYLNIEIYDDIKFITNNDRTKSKISVAKKLLASVKKYITETNFISINNIAGQSAVALDMKIIKLVYNTDSSSIKGVLEVEFNIRKHEVLYTQTYKYSINRYSRSGLQGLPSKSEILSEGANYLAKKLIKDISPLQTKKIVELLSLPDELAYTINYAKAGNYEGAIKAMLKYKGEKEYEYYFDLALYYEGYASVEDDMTFLVKANENYELAMAKGGSDDEVVLKGKNKFDNLYKIIKKLAEQKMKNEKTNNNSKYELLD